MNARESVRKLLDGEMTAAELEQICSQHGIQLPHGTSRKNAMNAVILKKAREGDPEYIEAAKKIGLLPDGEPNG